MVRSAAVTLPKDWTFKQDKSGRPQWAVASARNGSSAKVVHVLSVSNKETLCGNRSIFRKIDIDRTKLRKCIRCSRRLALKRPGGRNHIWQKLPVGNLPTKYSKNGPTADQLREGANLAALKCRTLAQMTEKEIRAIELEYGAKVLRPIPGRCRQKTLEAYTP